jgi:hypothetical protein
MLKDLGRLLERWERDCRLPRAASANAEAQDQSGFWLDADRLSFASITPRTQHE